MDQTISTMHYKELLKDYCPICKYEVVGLLRLLTTDLVLEDGLMLSPSGSYYHGRCLQLTHWIPT